MTSSGTLTSCIYIPAPPVASIMGGSASAAPQSPLPSLEGFFDLMVFSRAGFPVGEDRWRPVKCVLAGSTLSCPEDQQLHAEQFLLQSEDLRTLTLTVMVQQEKTWILRAKDVDTFTTWAATLKKHRRPKFTASPQCQICQKRFFLLRSRRYCSNCGRTLCRACCNATAFLPSLGYIDLQPVCQQCVTHPDVRSAAGQFQSNRDCLMLNPCCSGPGFLCF